MSKYEELSAERKRLQSMGKLPEWFTTIGYQAFKKKYLYQAETYEEQIDRIVNNLGKYLKPEMSTDYIMSRWKFLLMNNHAYLATPVLANNGTDRGLSVSCSGGVVADSIYGFADSRLENAVLSQNGFGTSSYLSNVRPRGSKISRGGTADGILPVFKDMVTGAENVSQGGVRRGAWAGYVDLAHGDFWEIALEVKNNPDGSNVGWNVYDKDVEALNAGDPEMTKRFQEALYVKAITGRGYFYFPDKVARAQPACYAEHGLRSQGSNLCTEITLHSDEETSFSCVISGMVLTTFDEWKETDAVMMMTIMLDCLVSDFLATAQDIKGIERVIAGTLKSRAIGLGATGYHSALQQRGLAWGSLQAHLFNKIVFKLINQETRKASRYLASVYGEPDWCKGTGYRNTHLTALAPNVSSSLIFGSESQGITPWYGNVYTEGSASGEMYRVNPMFRELMKKYGKDNDETYMKVLNDGGSAKNLDFLTEQEKKVFLTFFEIDQLDIIKSAAARQPYICQSQSLNLAFAADESEEYIAHVHQKAFENEQIKSLYYLRSRSGVDASKGGCDSCAS